MPNRRVKLYVDWVNKRLIQGPTNAGRFILPPFYQGDVQPIEIRLYEPRQGLAPSTFDQVDISNMALKFAVGPTPTGTAGGPSLYVSQFTWAKDTSDGVGFFHAEVAFNTSEVATLLGSSDTKTAILELEITDGTAVYTILQETVTIKAEVVEAASVSVLPGETALSQEVADQRYVLQVGGAGQAIILTSPDGTKQGMLYWGDDGSFHADPIA